MFDLSWHTHQINLWISLTSFQPTYSETLDALGYECDVIEDRFYIQDGDGENVIHPDVILTSDSRGHSLLIDCKSNEVDPSQLSRYLEIEGNEEQLVIQGIVDGVSAGDLNAEVVLSSFDKLDDPRIPEEFAVIHFDQDPYSGLAIWNLEEYPFNYSDLIDTFPINVDPSQPLPSGHYPYDIYEADKEAMVSNIFSTVMSLSIQEGEFSLEVIAERSHPYWDKLGSEKQTEIIDRIEVVYLELLNLGLDEYIEKIAGTNGQEWRRNSKTIQAIQRKTDYYVKRVLEELPQARLDHSAWSADSDDEGEAVD